MRELSLRLVRWLGEIFKGLFNNCTYIKAEELVVNTEHCPTASLLPAGTCNGGAAWVIYF